MHRLHAGLLVLALTGTATADDVLAPPEIIDVPAECAHYWTNPGGVTSPPGWNPILSFASCTQRVTVGRVERVEMLPGLVDQLQLEVLPSLQWYFWVVKHGPDTAKLRAAFLIAMTEVSVMTRARSSIVAGCAHHAELHARLEPLLLPQARLALMVFTAIDDVATANPALAPDLATRNMVRAARVQARALARGLERDEDEDDVEDRPILAR
jgi:hypothetical protein